MKYPKMFDNDKLPSWDSEDVKLSDLRMVEVSFVRNYRVSSQIMHKDHVAAYVKAQMLMHVSPGINPSTRKGLDRAWKIEEFEMVFHPFYWWSAPSLMNNDPNGASMVDKLFANTVIHHFDEESLNKNIETNPDEEGA